jgi:hypothetical protein
MGHRDRIEDHPEELDLLDYLFGQLPREASDQIRKHVGACRACQRTMGDLSVTVDELDRLPTITIPHDSLYADEDVAAPRRSRLTLLPAIAILVAGVLALAMLVVERTAAPGSRPSAALTILSVDDLRATLTRASGSRSSELRLAYDFTSREWLVLAPRGRFAAIVSGLEALPRGGVHVAIVER